MVKLLLKGGANPRLPGTLTLVTPIGPVSPPNEFLRCKKVELPTKKLAYFFAIWNDNVSRNDASQFHFKRSFASLKEGFPKRVAFRVKT